MYTPRGKDEDVGSCFRTCQTNISWNKAVMGEMINQLTTCEPPKGDGVYLSKLEPGISSARAPGFWNSGLHDMQAGPAEKGLPSVRAVRK